MPDIKVTSAHLERDAYLYIRQSTARQVIENTESTLRQYALRELAVTYGWPLERIHIIDSGAFFRQPAEEYRQLLEFLGVREFELTGFAQHNARSGAPMEPRTRLMLEEHYGPHDERLAKLLDRSLSWCR